MAATDIFWVGGAAAVAQVNNVTVASVAGGDDVLTITLSDDAGNTHDVTSTNPASVSAGVAALVAAAVAAKAAGNRPWTDVTATDADPAVTITADTAGKRFYVATTVSGGASLTDVATTANSGPSDLLCAENLSSEAVPAADDLLNFPSGASGSVLYGLTATTAYAGIVVEKGCALSMGHARQSLVVTLDHADSGSEVRLAGTGQKFLYFAGGGDPIYIDQSAGDTSGLPGTVIETAGAVDYDVYVNIGSGQTVGFAMTESQVMKIKTLTLAGGGKAVLGPGVTGDPDIEVVAGNLETYCGVGTVAFNGTTWTHYEGTLTQGDMKAGKSYVLSEDLAAGTVLNLYSPAWLIMGPRAGAITKIDVHGKNWCIYDLLGKITEYEMNQCSPADGRLYGPPNRQWTQATIS